MIPGAPRTLDRALLIALSRDPRYRTLLPALEQIQLELKQPVKKSGCGCNRRSNTVSEATIDRVKAQLVNQLANRETAAMLKKSLKTSELRIKLLRDDKKALIVKVF